MGAFCVCFDVCSPEDVPDELEAALLANDDDFVPDGDPSPLFAAAGAAAEERSMLVPVPGGETRYYHADGRFQATCHNVNHRTTDGTPCRLTRTSIGVDGSANGRPIGLLAAWCADGMVKREREDHRNVFYICGFARDKRCRGREVVRSQPRGPEMMRKERPQRADEPEEPMDVPMGW